MPIYRPKELLAFLESLGMSPKRALSQNFLIDGNIVQKIVKTADLKSGDPVMEIGPGPGSLTEELLKTGANVIAVEKDRALASSLQRLQTPDNRLTVYQDDILEFPIDTVLAPGIKTKVIANLPYNITTPIISSLVKRHDLFSHMILMVQDEVARRFTAAPRTPEYSSYTIFLNFYSRVRYAFTVNNTCFYPSPKVNSAIVVFEPKEPPYVSDVDKFFVLTRTAFHQRRKMMRGSLRDLYTPSAIEAALIQVNHSPLARPEELSLDDFLALFEILQK